MGGNSAAYFGDRLRILKYKNSESVPEIRLHLANSTDHDSF